MELSTAMLADAASVENGKLYIHGGAWTVINAADVPVTHPSISLALVLRVEYTEALQNHTVTVDLVDEDDQPIGPRVEGTIQVGHPPGTRPGNPSFIPQALRFNLVRFEREGGYRFRVSSGGRELASVPFRLVLHGHGQGR